jgi:hypothetical protein
MLTKKTVLVLGAGASIPFGFPSGQKLLRDIVKETAEPKRTCLGEVLLQCGFNESYIKAFSSALLKSQRMSVDAFLEHRQDFWKSVKRPSLLR